MNERIKELVLSLYPEPELKDRNFGLGAQLRAAQQGIEVLDITEEWLRKEYPWEPCIRYKDIPKFAELIVRECAELLLKEAMAGHDEGSDTYNLLIRESYWLKRYFGDKE